MAQNDDLEALRAEYGQLPSPDLPALDDPLRQDAVPPPLPMQGPLDRALSAGNDRVDTSMQGLDEAIYDTRNVLNRLPQGSFLTDALRGLSGIIRRDSRDDNVLAEGIDSASNWLDFRPRPGPDTILPFGMSAVGAMGLGLAGRSSNVLYSNPFGPLPPREATAAARDVPTQAAVVLNGKQHVGPTHLDAWYLHADDAQIARDSQEFWNFLNRHHGDPGVDVFVTSSGRIVDRAEGLRLATEAGYRRPPNRHREALEGGNPGLEARELEHIAALPPRDLPPRERPRQLHLMADAGMPRVPATPDELGFRSSLDEAARAWVPSGLIPSARDPNWSPRGSASELRQWLLSNGTTAREIEARGLNELLSDPRRTVTRQEVLQHLDQNPINFRQKVFGGEEYEPALHVIDETRMDRADSPDGIIFHVEDQQSNRGFDIHVDRDAGNVAVQRHGGGWLDVPGQPNRQTYQHGIQAIEDYLKSVALGVGQAGPARHSEWAFNPNRTYEERVLHMSPDENAARRAWEAESRPKPWDQLSDADRHYFSQKLTGTFNDGHYPEAPNPIGWIRRSVQNRAIPLPGVGNHNRAMLWDELQMPWAQRIRDQGGPADVSRIDTIKANRDAAFERRTEHARAGLELAQEAGLTMSRLQTRDGTPDIPAVHTAMEWVADDPAKYGESLAARANELRDALKFWLDQERLRQGELETMRNATTSGHALVNNTEDALRALVNYGLLDPGLQNVGGIALASGAMQNDRFRLARHVAGLRYDPARQRLEYMGYAPAYGRPGRSSQPNGYWSHYRNHQQDYFAPHELPNLIGHDMTQALIARPLARSEGALAHQGEHTWHTLGDLADVEIGGHGMRATYDQMYPDMIEAILRRLDRRYPGRSRIQLEGMDEEVPFFPLTEAIREQIGRGLPPFAAGGAVDVPEFLDRSLPEEYGVGTPAPDLPSLTGLDAAVGMMPPERPVLDSEVLDTAGINRRVEAAPGGISAWMHRLADSIRGWASPEGPPQPVRTLTGREQNLRTRGAEHNVPLLASALGVHMPAGALSTMGNWLNWDPEIGQDTLAPLGMAAFGVAPVGALGAGAARRRLPPIEPETGQWRLPMELPGTRAERAEGMGFRGPEEGGTYYHETGRSNVASINRHGFERRGGAGDMDYEMPLGTFVKPHAEEIGVAQPGQRGPAQIPLLARLTNPARFVGREELAAFLGRDDTYRQLVKDARDFHEHGMSDLDARHTARFEELSDQPRFSALTDEHIDQINARLNRELRGEEERVWQQTYDLVSRARERATQLLRDAGHDGLMISRDEGSGGRFVPTTIVFDPQNLRRPNARFDPMDADSTNLLAAENQRASLPGAVANAAAEQQRDIPLPPRRGPGNPNRVVFTPEMRTALAEMYHANVPMEHIAERLGVDVQTLRRQWPRLQEELGLEHRDAINRRDPAVGEEAARLYREGLTHSQIASRLGYHPGGGYMSRLLQDAGVELNRAMPPRPEGWAEQVTQMRRDGHSFGEIGRSLNMTRNQVAGMVRDLRARGVAIPSAVLAMVAADWGGDNQDDEVVPLPD